MEVGAVSSRSVTLLSLTAMGLGGAGETCRVSFSLWPISNILMGHTEIVFDTQSFFPHIFLFERLRNASIIARLAITV